MSLESHTKKRHSMDTSDFWWSVTTVALMIGIGLCTSSCTTSSATTRVLVDQSDKSVGMEITYRKGSPEYSHPRSLNPRILEQALQAIQVEPLTLLDRIAGASSQPQEAFTKEEREFLAKHLTSALQKATPLETVTFHWSTSRGDGIWEITSGGLFLQENDLHFILPNYRYTVSAKHQSQKPRHQPLSQLGEPLHSLKGIAPAQQLKHGMLSELWAPQTPHFVFPLNELTNAPLTIGNQQAESSTQPLNSGKSIKQRLKKLEELREEGLLSGKEYQDKRQEILNEL